MMKFFITITILCVSFFKITDTQVNNVEAFQDIKDYYISHGSLIHGYISHNKNGTRGLFADKDFKENEIIMKIPKELTYDCQTEDDFTCTLEFQKHVNKFMKNKKLSDQIKYFLPTCPTYQEYKKSIPFALPFKILKKFRELPIVERSLSQKKFFKNNLMQPYGPYAYYIVNSRSIHVPINGKQRAFLVGYMDMINHSSFGDENVHWDLVNGNLNCKASRYIKKDEELIFDYFDGMKQGNDKLVFVFGFYENGNPNPIERLDIKKCQKLKQNFKDFDHAGKYEYIIGVLFKMYKERCEYDLKEKIEL